MESSLTWKNCILFSGGSFFFFSLPTEKGDESVSDHSDVSIFDLLFTYEFSSFRFCKINMSSTR